MKGKSELPPGAQGIGDVLSHLSKLNVHAYALEMIIQHSSKFNHINYLPQCVSIKCHKTKSNYFGQSKRRRQSSRPIKTRSNYT